MIYKKILIITFGLILMQTMISAAASINNIQDEFGITKLYDNDPGGREWISKWDNGYERTWTDATDDPYDPEFVTKDKGIGTYKTDGNGIFKISGSTPRMYVVDLARTRGWKNVEITVYARRISDDSTSWGGIMAYARTNHLIDSNYCDTRGYGGRFRYDGNTDFEKETKHDTGFYSVATKTYWPAGMTKNLWIGYKYVVYDMPDGNVKLELWIDKTDGLNGGNWTKVNEFIDTGSNFGVGGTPCRSGINPALRLTASDSRPGSETGKPNIGVYFRSDGVGTDGLWYKKASIREIVPVQSQDATFINGTVMDSINKRGIAGATVFTNTSLSTITDATGFYSFAVVADVYNITAKFEPTYYVNNTITVSTIGSSVVVQNIELLKKPTGNITGSVI